jgi:hypothetical protein
MIAHRCYVMRRAPRFPMPSDDGVFVARLGA